MLNLFGYVRTDPRSVHVFSGEPRPYFTPGGLDLLNTNPALWLDDLSCQFDKLSAWGLWKKKQSSFASCDWALLFYLPNFFLARLNKGLTSETFFSPSQVRFVELSDNAKILPKCRETWLVLFSATGKAENLSKCRQAWLILFRRFCERKSFQARVH